MKFKEYVSFKFGKKLIKSMINILGDQVFEFLSSNPNITLSHVLLYIEKPWNWFRLSKHQNIEFSDIYNNLQFQWNWKGVSLNPNITSKHVIQYPELPWDYLYLSLNPNIKFEDLNIFENWDWSALSNHVPYDYIMNNLDLPWNFEELCCNPTFTFNKLVKVPNILLNPWKMSKIVKLEDTCHFKFCFWSLSENPNLTLDFILEHVDEKLNWDLLNDRFNLPNEIIKRFNLIPRNIMFKDIKNWSINILYKYLFTDEYNILEQKCRKKWNAVNLIKKNYLLAFWNPEYYLGRKRLERSLREDYSVW